jgi:hypothetical protein
MKGMLELQLTCGALHDSQIPFFIATCEQVGLRPLLIDHHHDAGQPRQPSATAWLRADLHEVRAEAMALAQWLARAGMAVLSVKVDAPVQDSGRFGQGVHGGQYFEWRGTLRRPQDMAALQAACKAHGAQLSRDSLSDARDTCFATLRSREPLAGFDARVAALTEHLAREGWPLLKQDSEVCLHDSREVPMVDWLAPYLLPPRGSRRRRRCLARRMPARAGAR